MSIASAWSVQQCNELDRSAPGRTLSLLGICRRPRAAAALLAYSTCALAERHVRDRNHHWIGEHLVRAADGMLLS